ncbi:MAG TPA: polymorphic toxin-type HINT domain-containing protein [Anaerolineae bacterium]|nr:polymorphic toxin-type HINT domain-containing protein [Anaerolineae bacterium]
MGQLSVVIQDHMGAKQTPVQLRDDVPARQLVSHLVSEMGLSTMQADRPIHYRLEHKRTGKRLRDQDTLQSAHVQEDDVLVLIPVVTAGCFLRGTQVMLPDGASVAIEKLKAGDRVLSLDTARNALSKCRVVAAYEGMASEYLVLNHRLAVTGTHLVKTNGDWIPAKRLKVGDYLHGLNGRPVLVTHIENVHEVDPVVVHNLHLQERHTFFADGILVHNAQSKQWSLAEPLRITREDIDDMPMDAETVTRWSVMAYISVISALCSVVWVSHGAESSSLLRLLSLVLSSAVTLCAGRVFILASRVPGSWISPRGAVLLCMAFLFVTLELLLAVIVR